MRIRTLSLLLALALAGCSTPETFGPAMGKFAEATGSAEAALEAYDKALAARVTALRRAEAVQSPHAVRAIGDGCTTGSTACTVALLAAPGDPEPQPLTVDSFIPNHLAAMREVRLYGGALEAIAKADATPAIQAAFDQASATAVSLAQLSGQPGLAPAVKAFSVPVSKAGVWLYGVYQESLKLDALREATQQMDPVMQEAVAKFSKAADYASLGDKTRLVRVFDARMQAFEDQSSEATLRDLLDAARNLDAALAAQPGAVFQQLGQAHRELTEALKADDITFADAIRHIDRLVAEAEKLEAIAREFQEAVETVSGG